ncbi:hypothetical protein F6R98_03500 [Candidatus Methylospira mobilis]|uniref:Uncharacterized protein n=1 Tax=Candidatus Methylospira mobilis TaxID=1808979 RepID=A0A5Q0BI49_9GAMM|nr:DUF6629 family protein [Candidatus Methylospira mobilis]QFY41808.1 hypothetical protein F6R98_03500 [Candidatus Methylospira mobilis]WNV06671.1 DUF6629 family protein [Candidatus Methylospira mobilis]
MCWSEQVSFSSGAVLVGAGIITIRHARKNDRSAFFFSLFPVFFGLHQLLEGLIWHYLSRGQSLRALPYAYLSIAALLWPVAVPIASMQAEKFKNKRKILFIPALAGLFVTLYSGSLLWNSNGANVLLNGHSLSYSIETESRAGVLIEYLYAFAVVMSLIFNTRKMVKLFGLSVMIAFAITFMLLHDVYISVWCLMSAWLSLIIYFIIEKQRTDQEHYRKSGTFLLNR